MPLRYTLFLLPLLLAPLGLRAQTGTCTLGDATADLHANDVRARLFNNGGLFWKGAGNVYNVPAVADGKPITPNALFAAGIWFGGHVGQELRMVAADFGRWELWPGPLDALGQAPADCTPYDRIFSIRQTDVLDYEQHGIISADLRDWPWQWGAPVVDGDGDPSNYDLAAGDRPEILGHETHWWVMNDAAGVHTSTGTKPLGMEVRVSAFAVASPVDALNETTLYRYRLTYRGMQPLSDAYVGFWADTDLGNATDDYVGSDTTLDMGYVYNGDDFDEGSDGYGQAPPALGVVVLKGAKPEGPALSAFISPELSYGPLGSPLTGVPSDSYNLLRGRWMEGGDGVRLTTCGVGYPGFVGPLPCDSTAQPTTYLYAGDPVTGAFWSERNYDDAGTANPPNDRIIVVSNGPFAMEPGETKEVVFAIVYARGSDHIDSVTRLRQAARTVRQTWATDSRLATVPLPAVPTSAPTFLQSSVTARDTTYAFALSWHALGDDYRYEVAAEVAAFDTLIATNATARTVDLSAVVAAGRVLPGSVGRWRVRATTLGGRGPWSEWQRLELGTAEQRLNEDRFHVAVVGAQPVASVLRVRYAVGIAGAVRLALYDVLGRRVAVLHEGAVFAGGPYEAAADVSGLASGVYLVRLESEGPSVQTDAVRVVITR